MGTYGRKFIYFDHKGYEALSKLMMAWQRNQSISIDNKSLAILEHFASNPRASIYSCFKFLKTKQETKISYKSVHKKVHNLLRMDFIKKIEENLDKNEIVMHGAIFYKLTDYGIFYVLKNRLGNNFFDPSLDVLYNYENFFLFKYLLYPVLQHVSIQKTGANVILHLIETFLYDCTVVIEELYTHFSIPLLLSIQRIGGLIYTHEFSGQLYLEEFEMGFPLSEILNESTVRNRYTISKMVTEDKEIIVTLRIDARNLIFKSNDNKLYVYENSEDNLIFETEIDLEYDNDLNKIVSSYVKIDITELLESYFKQYFRYDIYINLIKLFTGIIRMSSYSEVENDLLLLKKDNNFMSALYTIKSISDENFATFEALK